MVPIYATSLRSQVYQAAGMRGCVADSTPSANHSMFEADDCRIDETWSVNQKFMNQHSLTGTQSATGSIYYLPYHDDDIYSMVLPGNPPAGCRKFLTANLSGCRIYVDGILGSNDVIVYHANTHMHGAALGAAANAQSVGASNILDGLHQTAKADYRALNPAVNPIDRVELVKYDYMMSGETECLRKRNQGRQSHQTVLAPGTGQLVAAPATADFIGGTTVCGFYLNGWRFYYQTWGIVEYDRPGGKAEAAKLLFTGQWNNLHKLRVEGTRHSGTTAAMRVLHNEQFV